MGPLKCITSTYEQGLRKPGGWHGFDMQPRMAQGSHMSLLPEVREKTTLADGNWFPKSLRNAVFYLVSRKPPLVQLELIPVYLDSCENSWSSLLLMIRGDVVSLF